MTRDEAAAALQLDGEISPETIKSQYRKLSLLVHPDRFRDAAGKKKAHGDFLRIRDAYEFFKKNPYYGYRSTSKGGTAAGRDDGSRMDDAQLKEWIRRFQEQEEAERGAGGPGIGGLTPRETWSLKALAVLAVCGFVLMWWGLDLGFHFAFWRTLRWAPFAAGICCRGGRAVAIFIVCYYFLMRWGLDYDSYGMVLVMMRCVMSLGVVYYIRTMWG